MPDESGSESALNLDARQSAYSLFVRGASAPANTPVMTDSDLPEHVRANRAYWDSMAGDWVSPGERSWLMDDPTILDLHICPEGTPPGRIEGPVLDAGR